MHSCADLPDFTSVARLFKLLSDNTRVKIFWLLCHQRESVSEISRIIGVTSPCVVHHLNVLKENMFVTSIREGKEVYYQGADNEGAELLHSVIEKVSKTVCPVESSGIEKQIHKYLTDNLSMQITADQLCKRFYISKASLATLFKKTYGCSLSAHIRKHRMEKGYLLLEQGNLSVGEVAVMVGYASRSKFAAAFKKEFGISPKQVTKFDKQ